jgi:hypothetical protein
VSAGTPSSRALVNASLLSEFSLDQEIVMETVVMRSGRAGVSTGLHDRVNPSSMIPRVKQEVPCTDPETPSWQCVKNLRIKLLGVPPGFTDEFQLLDQFVLVIMDRDMLPVVLIPVRLQSSGRYEPGNCSSIAHPCMWSNKPRQIGECLSTLRVRKRRETQMNPSIARLERLMKGSLIRN